MSLVQRLYDLDRPFPERLDELLHDKKYVDQLRELPEQELLQVVDHLNEILVHLDRTGGSSRKCLQVLRKICGFRKVIPTTYDLSKDLLLPNGPPRAHGGFSDTYEGTVGVQVCIKRLKVPVTCDHEKAKELFCKEAVVWRHLNHLNIVPFKGVTLDPLQLVSEWMPGGELRHYARNNLDINLLGLLLGVARGLVYLHSKGVIHGDLKGPNIMMDEHGNARITDFGLAKIVKNSNSLTSTSGGQGQSLRWTAPELLESDKMATKESDVHSFAMVVIEVFTGEVPFKESQAPQVVMCIINGERPGRPSHPKFTDNMWELTQRCWNRAAEDRPKMEDVVKELSASSFSDTLPASSEELPWPITGTNDGETSSSNYSVDDNRGPELSPLFRTGDDGSSHGPTYTPGDGRTERSSSGSESSSDNGTTDGVEGSYGEVEDEGLERYGADETFTTGVPPSVLPGRPMALERVKKHGLWCRARSRILSILK